MTESIKLPQSDDFVDFSSIFFVLKEQWRLFSVVLIGAIVVGVMAYSLVQPRWQAETTLRVGQVMLISSGRSTTELIEPVREAVARMQLAQFQAAVLASPALQDLEQDEITLFKKTFKAALVKGTNFIHVSVSGNSPEAARKMLKAAIGILFAVHQEKMQPAIQQMRDRIDSLNGRIVLKQKSLERLKQMLEGKSTDDTVGVLDLLDRQQTEIQQLTDERSEMERMSRSPQTFNTAVEDAVRTGGKPYFPRLSIFLIASVLIGGVIGFIISLCRYRKNLNH